MAISLGILTQHFQTNPYFNITHPTTAERCWKYRSTCGRWAWLWSNVASATSPGADGPLWETLGDPRFPDGFQIFRDSSHFQPQTFPPGHCPSLRAEPRPQSVEILRHVWHLSPDPSHLNRYQGSSRDQVDSLNIHCLCTWCPHAILVARQIKI